MPGGDGTGPMGLGAMTGRRAGYCAGFAVPGYVNPILGGGYGGWRRGGGRGLRWSDAPGMVGWRSATFGWPAAFGRWPAVAYVSPLSTLAHQRELDVLRGQAEYLENVLVNLRQRIDQLQTGVQSPVEAQPAGNT